LGRKQGQYLTAFTDHAHRFPGEGSSGIRGVTYHHLPLPIDDQDIRSKIIKNYMKKDGLWFPKEVLLLDTQKVNYSQKAVLSYLMTGKKSLNEGGVATYVSWKTPKDIAKALGMTQVYVWKVLRNLKEAGIVTEKDGTFLVRDVSTLDHLLWTQTSGGTKTKGVWVGDWILTSKGMVGFLDKVVYAFLLSLGRNCPQVWVGNSYLSEMFAIPKNRVSLVLGRLERRGLIGRELVNRRTRERSIFLGDYRNINTVIKSRDMEDENYTVNTKNSEKEAKNTIILGNKKYTVNTKNYTVNTKNYTVNTNLFDLRRRRYNMLVEFGQAFSTKEVVFEPNKGVKNSDENVVNSEYSGQKCPDNSIRIVGRQISLLSYRIIGIRFSPEDFAGYFRASRGHASRAIFSNFFLLASETGEEGGTAGDTGKVLACTLTLRPNEARGVVGSEKRKKRQDTVPRVNEAIELFEEVFPVEFHIQGKRPYQKIGTRIAVEGVLRTHGFEALREAVSLFKLYRTRKYYPGSISTVAEFCYKYDKVVVGNEREQVNDNQHKPAPVLSEGVKPGQMEKMEHMGGLTHDMQTPLLDAVAADVLQRLEEGGVPFQWVRKAVYLSACAAIRFWVPDYQPITSLYDLYWKRAERDIEVYLQEGHFHADDSVPSSVWDKKAIDAMMHPSYEPMPYKNYPFFTSLMKEKK
jgi:DNA-binding MarR family transcriptional regulator